MCSRATLDIVTASFGSEGPRFASGFSSQSTVASWYEVPQVDLAAHPVPIKVGCVPLAREPASL